MKADPNVCSDAAVAVKPVINRNRCEGKAACVVDCPYGVFEIATLPVGDRKQLSLRGKLKGWGHKWQQAFATRADECRACGKCVETCPEGAISLEVPEIVDMSSKA